MQFTAIQQRCANMLLHCLSHNNILQIYTLAELTGTNELAKQAFAYILYNFDTLSESKEKFAELSLDILSKILEHKYLNCNSEMDILQIANHWIGQQEGTVDEDDTFRLISCARFQKLDSPQLKKVSSLPVIQNSQLLSKIVATLIVKSENPHRELKPCQCYCHESAAASMKVSSCQRCRDRGGQQSTSEKDSDSTQELLERETSCCVRASGCLFPCKRLLKNRKPTALASEEKTPSKDVCYPPEILRLCDKLLNSAPRAPPFAACVVAHVRSGDVLTGIFLTLRFKHAILSLFLFYR